MKKRKISVFVIALVLLLACAAITACGKVTDATVTFDANGGWMDELDGEMTTTSLTVKIGEKVKKPMSPVAKEKTFVDWFTETEGGEKWSFDDPVTKSMTLYARWQSQISVTYYVPFENGFAVANTIKVIEGQKVAPITSQLVTGYRINEWYTDSDYTGEPWDFSKPVEAEMKLYAKLELIDGWEFKNSSLYWFTETGSATDGDDVLTVREDSIRVDFAQNNGADSRIRVDNLMMPLDDKEILKIRYKNPGTCVNIRTYFTTESVIAFGQFAELTNVLKSGMSESDAFEEVLIDMSSCSNWRSGENLTALRIDFPTVDENNSFIIESITFMKKPNADKLGWQFPLNHNAFKTVGGSMTRDGDSTKLAFGAGAAEKYIQASGISVPIGSKNSVVMTYSNPSTVKNMALYFTTDKSATMNETKKAALSVRSGMKEGEFAEAEIDLHEIVEWKNKVTNIRFVFVTDEEVSFSIKSIFIEDGQPDIELPPEPEVEIQNGWQFPSYRTENPTKFAFEVSGYSDSEISDSVNGTRFDFGSSLDGAGYSRLLIKDQNVDVTDIDIIAIRYKNISPLGSVYFGFTVGGGSAFSEDNKFSVTLEKNMDESSDWASVEFEVSGNAAFTGTLSAFRLWYDGGNGNSLIIDSIELKTKEPGIDEPDVDGWQFPKDREKLGSGFSAPNYTLMSTADGLKFTANTSGEAYFQMLGLKRTVEKTRIRLRYKNTSSTNSVNMYLGHGSTLNQLKQFANVLESNMSEDDDYAECIFDLTEFLKDWEGLSQFRFGLSSVNAGDVLVIDSIEFLHPIAVDYIGWRFPDDHASMHLTTSNGYKISTRSDAVVFEAESVGAYVQILAATVDLTGKSKVEITYINTSAASGADTLQCYVGPSEANRNNHVQFANILKTGMDESGAFETVTLDFGEKFADWSTLEQFRFGLGNNSAGDKLIIKSIEFKA